MEFTPLTESIATKELHDFALCTLYNVQAAENRPSSRWWTGGLGVLPSRFLKGAQYKFSKCMD